MKSRCPECKKIYKERPAISRKDNKTEICPQCGQIEAINEFIINHHKEIEEGLETIRKRKVAEYSQKGAI